MDDIGKQFDTLVDKAMPVIDENILLQMNNFGDDMVQNIIPIQRGFKNLTGNTITSFAYGTYINKVLKQVGMYNGKAAIRVKLTKGEVFTGIDYDGDYRKHFVAEIETDQGLGTNTSMKFLQGYIPTGYYSIVFTTGTEYSEFLENRLHFNVLTDARTFSIQSFIRSFKPITNDKS